MYPTYSARSLNVTLSSESWKCDYRTCNRIAKLVENVFPCCRPAFDSVRGEIRLHSELGGKTNRCIPEAEPTETTATPLKAREMIAPEAKSNQAVPRFLSDDIAKSSQAFSNSQLGCKRTITPAATRRKASEVFAAKNCHPFIPPHRNSALFVPYLSDIANFKWLAIENWNGHDYRNLCPSAQGISRLRSRKIFLLVQFSLVAAAFLIVQPVHAAYLCIGNNRHHRRAERGER